MKKTVRRENLVTSQRKKVDKALLNEIRFYRATEKPYGAFSNLYRRPVVFEGREFPTAEHAYQAGKARKENVRKWVLSAPTPSLVAMAAHGLYSWDVVSDWAKIKYDRMRGVLRAKFSQHEDLMHLLLSTGDARLVEVARVNNVVNRTWGEVSGKGQNMLGVLLMELRAELRQNDVGRTKFVTGRTRIEFTQQHLRTEQPLMPASGGQLESKDHVDNTLRRRTGQAL